MTSIDPPISEGAVQTDVPIRSASSVWWTGLAAAAAWVGTAELIELWPEVIPQPYGRELAAGALVIALVLAVVAATGTLGGKAAVTIRYYGPWFLVSAVVLSGWELVTAKTGLLPVPFFSSPQSILEVFFDDWERLGTSVFYSVLLLAKGYFFGALAGFLTGVTIGWSRAASYWVHPVLRLVGPLPATAWLPLAFSFFRPAVRPASFSSRLPRPFRSPSSHGRVSRASIAIIMTLPGRWAPSRCS